MTGKFLFAVALAAGTTLAAAPAAGAVMVIGNTSARICYEAAEARMAPSWDSFANCDRALNEEGLTEFDRVATYVNRGILRLRTGKVDAAIADFDVAIGRDPSLGDAYLNKGIALVRASRDWDEAIGLFNTAIEKRTRRPALAYYGRGVANEMKGRIKDAYLDYREANRIEPKWREPQTDLARFTVQRP
ncbi:MAG: tetratricopeptide repeat protein [Alphaproteobacteria bacterium]|nr:tetratricopeptide repeat protein [Alphaproteobacteria bacterium]